MGGRPAGYPAPCADHGATLAAIGVAHVVNRRLTAEPGIDWPPRRRSRLRTRRCARCLPRGCTPPIRRQGNPAGTQTRPGPSRPEERSRPAPADRSTIHEGLKEPGLAPTPVPTPMPPRATRRPIEEGSRPDRCGVSSPEMSHPEREIPQSRYRRSPSWHRARPRPWRPGSGGRTSGSSCGSRRDRSTPRGGRSPEGSRREATAPDCDAGGRGREPFVGGFDPMATEVIAAPGAQAIGAPS